MVLNAYLSPKMMVNTRKFSSPLQTRAGMAQAKKRNAFGSVNRNYAREQAIKAVTDRGMSRSPGAGPHKSKSNMKSSSSMRPSEMDVLNNPKASI